MTTLKSEVNQSALRHGPGKFSAIVAYSAEGVEVGVVRKRASLLMRWFGTAHEQLRVRGVVGLSPRMLQGLPGFMDTSGQVFPADGEGYAFVRKPADLLVQLACESETALRRGLRAVAEFTQNASDGYGPLLQVTEVSGARIYNGEEAFGFRDGSKFEDYNKQVVGDLDGVGAWLLFQLYEQDVARFFAEQPSAVERADVMGRAPHGLPVDATDSQQAVAAAVADRAQAQAAVVDGGHPNSHWGRMRGTSATPMPLIRRGFPCRSGGRDAMAFVGVAASVGTISDALQRLVGFQNGEQDRLLRYVTPVDGNIFFCPAEADWLAADMAAPEVPACVKQLDRRPALVDYLVVQKFHEYLMALRQHGLFDNREVPTAVSALARPHLDALYKALASTAPNPAEAEAQLRALERATVRDALALNLETDEYVSFG